MVDLVGSLVVYLGGAALIWVLGGVGTMCLFRAGTRTFSAETFASVGGIRETWREEPWADNPFTFWIVTLFRGDKNFTESDANEMLWWGPFGLLGMCFTLGIVVFVETVKLIGRILSNIGGYCARTLNMLPHRNLPPLPPPPPAAPAPNMALVAEIEKIFGTSDMAKLAEIGEKLRSVADKANPEAAVAAPPVVGTSAPQCSGGPECFCQPANWAKGKKYMTEPVAAKPATKQAAAKARKTGKKPAKKAPKIKVAAKKR